MLWYMLLMCVVFVCEFVMFYFIVPSMAPNVRSDSENKIEQLWYSILFRNKRPFENSTVLSLLLGIEDTIT